MEIQIKYCMSELREILHTKVENHRSNITIQGREQSLRNKYGNDVFVEARKRLVELEPKFGRSI